MEETMIFEKRGFGNVVHHLRTCKLHNGKYTIAILNPGKSEWKPGIAFPTFNSKRSAEKWLKEHCDVMN